MNRFLVASLSLSLTALVACDPAGADDPADAGSTAVTVEQYIAKIDAKSCDLQVCVSGTAPSQCTPATGASDLPSIKKQIADGRVSFDAAKAKACVARLDGLSAATCWGPGKSFDFAAFLADCLAVVQGKVAAAGACFETSECADGYCDSSAQVCPGQCRPLKAAGQSCAAGDECLDGLSCSGSKCTAPAAENASCATLDCADGLHCNDEEKCVKQAAPGAAEAVCDGVRPCGAGLFCLIVGEDATGKCQPRAAAGAACSEFSFGEAGDCASRQVCAGLAFSFADPGITAGTCATPQAVNGPCVPTPEDAFFATTGCFGGLVCDQATRKCAVPPALGQPCPDGECAAGAWCNDADTCAALKADGAACEGSEECVNTCDSSSGKCAPDPDEACPAP